MCCVLFCLIRLHCLHQVHVAGQTQNCPLQLKMEEGSSEAEVAAAVLEIVEGLGRLGVRLAEDVQVRSHLCVGVCVCVGGWVGAGEDTFV